MFGKRKTSQKPDEGLIRDFRKDFPHVISEPSVAQTLGHAGLGAAQYLSWDPNSAQSKFLNPMTPISQPHGLYTPLPGQMCAVLHSPAGDLHTPTVEWNLASSPFLWTQRIGAQVAPSQNEALTQSIEAFQTMDQSQLFHNVDPFGPEFKLSPGISRPSDHPEHVAPDNCERKQSYSESVREVSVDQSVSRSSSVPEHIASLPEIPFRYHVTLQAPTAMFDHTREVPVTYLNKSQVYSITVTDLRPPAARSQSAQYRTSIGISFEEAAHRSHPATCWQLWHDARGGSDAQRRGGRPCAVEFVALKGHGRPAQDLAWHLESASFNRFCVAWTTGADAHASECQILVRFHFLSTDFTQSKGVKGVPVRLCAKTEMVSAGESPGEVGPAEVCYCRVKVFRDHGAERKLSNDIAHIQKSIHRVEKQIARADYTGVPGKKHKRRHVLHDPTGSASRSSSVSTPGDLYKVLFDLQQRFSSPLPMSVLSLAGDEHDDPDQFATILTVENNSLTPPDAADTRSDDGPTDNGSRGHSPFQAWPGPPSTKVAPSDLQPVACFYIKIANDEDPNGHYRAAYLNTRTVRDLSWQVCKHAKVDPSSIVRVVHLKRTGLSILVDDDVVQHIPEGQDMIANFEEISTSSGDAPGRSRFEIQLSY